MGYGTYNRSLVALGPFVRAATRADEGAVTRLGVPSPASVSSSPAGVPLAVEGVAVESVREEWLVEDGWWTARPLRRRYFELALADGRNAVVFRDLIGGRWFSQRA